MGRSDSSDQRRTRAAMMPARITIGGSPNASSGRHNRQAEDSPLGLLSFAGKLPGRLGRKWWSMGTNIGGRAAESNGPATPRRCHVLPARRHGRRGGLSLPSSSIEEPVIHILASSRSCFDCSADRGRARPEPDDKAQVPADWSEFERMYPQATLSVPAAPAPGSACSPTSSGRAAASATSAGTSAPPRARRHAPKRGERRHARRRPEQGRVRRQGSTGSTVPADAPRQTQCRAEDQCPGLEFRMSVSGHDCRCAAATGRCQLHSHPFKHDPEKLEYSEHPSCCPVLRLVQASQLR